MASRDSEILELHRRTLRDLRMASRSFANAIIQAADVAKEIPYSLADDPLAIDTFIECQKYLLEAFAKAPGMIQIFTGAK